MTEAMRRSPHEVDPLSWFSGTLIPAVLGGLAMTFGLAVTLASQRGGYVPWFDWAAIAFLLLGFLAIGVVFSPKWKAPPLVATFIPVVFGVASLVLSTLGHIDGPRLAVDVWWAPIGLGFLIASLAPYSSANRLLIVGSVSTFVTAAVIIVIPFNRSGHWPVFSEGLIGSGPVLVATAAASMFAYQVVLRIEDWATMDPGSFLTSGVLGESAKLLILRNELASVSDRVVPLLQKIADYGVVTEEDRVQARLLSNEVRAELVERSNRSWLDTLAIRMNLTVLDAEHRADRMVENQRAALFGFLQAATEGIGEARTAIVIQLRGEEDGSTAVALSTDVHFPEGRRVTLLAPHFFSLKATVDGLEWDGGEQLRMRFRLPPEPK